jgi:hypothetical protein
MALFHGYAFARTATNTRYCAIQAGCCPRVATVDGHQTAVMSGATAQAVPKAITSIAGNTPKPIACG